MKTRFLFLLSLLVASLQAFAVDVFLSNGRVATTDHIPSYDVSVRRFDNRLQVCYKFDSIAIVQDPVFTDSYNFLINGFGNSTEEGSPAVPVLLERFAVPANCSYFVNIVYKHQYNRGIMLAPARPILPENSEYSFLTVPVKPIVLTECLYLLL